MEPAKVVEPELGVEAAGIVFDEGELHPSHRPIEPARRRLARNTRGCDRVGWYGAPRSNGAPGCDLQEIPPGERL
jgi:hypothetical protein